MKRDSQGNAKGRKLEAYWMRTWQNGVVFKTAMDEVGQRNVWKFIRLIDWLMDIY